MCTSTNTLNVLVAECSKADWSLVNVIWCIGGVMWPCGLGGIRYVHDVHTCKRSKACSLVVVLSPYVMSNVCHSFGPSHKPKGHITSPEDTVPFSMGLVRALKQGWTEPTTASMALTHALLNTFVGETPFSKSRGGKLVVMNSTEVQNPRRKLDDKCLCLSCVFGSVLACAKSAHVFQKLSCSLCGLCLWLITSSDSKAFLCFIAFSGSPTATHRPLHALRYYTVGIRKGIWKHCMWRKWLT